MLIGRTAQLQLLTINLFFNISLIYFIFSKQSGKKINKPKTLSQPFKNKFFGFAPKIHFSCFPENHQK